jgi:hypothetical protein
MQNETLTLAQESAKQMQMDFDKWAPSANVPAAVLTERKQRLTTVTAAIKEALRLDDENRTLKGTVRQYQQNELTEPLRLSTPPRIKNAFIALFISSQYPCMIKNPEACRKFFKSKIALQMRKDCEKEPTVLPHLLRAFYHLHKVSKTVAPAAAA